MPTISIDKTDGCQMYLSKDSLDTEIITAKSSEMNVLIPSGDDFVSFEFHCVILNYNNFFPNRSSNPCRNSSRRRSREPSS